MSAIPVQVTFRGLDHSEALEADVRERVAWLEQFYPSLMSCRAPLKVSKSWVYEHTRGPRHPRTERTPVSSTPCPACLV